MDHRIYMPPCDEVECSNPQVRGSRFCIYCLDKKDPEKDKTSVSYTHLTLPTKA